MKTLIVYGSKYGTTQKCAQEIAKKISGKVDVVNLKDNKGIDIADYDKVVIGSSVYAGMLRKEVKVFYESNKEILKKKKVAVFLCCMDKEGIEKYLSPVFDEDFRKGLIAKTCCGGEYKFSKMNFLERFMIKMITADGAKKGICEAADGKHDIESIIYDNISVFANNINKA